MHTCIWETRALSATTPVSTAAAVGRRASGGLLVMDAGRGGGGHCAHGRGKGSRTARGSGAICARGRERARTYLAVLFCSIFSVQMFSLLGSSDRFKLIALCLICTNSVLKVYVTASREQLASSACMVYTLNYSTLLN